MQSLMLSTGFLIEYGARALQSGTWRVEGRDEVQPFVDCLHFRSADHMMLEGGEVEEPWEPRSPLC